MHRVYHRGECAAALSAAERRQARRLGLSGARLGEWSAGRSAVRQLLAQLLGTSDHGVDTLSTETGAPVLTDAAGLRASITHDGDWVGVAVASAPVAVDLCQRRRASVAERVLARCGVAASGTCATEQWVAIECAVKLRGGTILDLLETGRVCAEVHGGYCEVTGIGEPVQVTLHPHADYVVGVAT